MVEWGEVLSNVRVEAVTVWQIGLVLGEPSEFTRVNVSALQVALDGEKRPLMPVTVP